MRIVILTQDDPFFLGRNIDYLIKKLPAHSQIISTVLFEVSPFGKRESFKDKMLKTLKVFGWPFFIYYGIQFLKTKINTQFAVKNVLNRHQVPIITLEKPVNHKESLQIIRDQQPDLLVSIGGNQIFKRPLLDIATHGCINLHTALLPKYRGLMPSFWVLRFNEKYTGISVFLVDEGIDSGPILVQKKIEIGERTQQELIRDTKEIGMDCIIEAIEKIHNGNYELIPNPAEEMTYYSFPTTDDVKAFKKAGKKFF